MNNFLKIQIANIGLLFFVCETGKNLFDLYQSNEPGFGIRLFAVVALVTAALLACKILLPWIAGLAVHHVAGGWIYAVKVIKWGVSTAVINGCGRLCRRVCRTGRPRT